MTTLSDEKKRTHSPYFPPGTVASIPFDRKKHNELMKHSCGVSYFGGYLDYRYSGDDSIYLKKIISYAPGFGRAAMRYLMELSFNMKRELRTEAIGNSHGFYNKMGWIPEKVDLSYISKKYVWYFSTRVDELCSCTSLEAVKKLSQSVREDLAYLLREERNLPPKTEITDAELWSQREWFAELQKKRVPYLSCVYIPNWLKGFKKNGKQPSTEHLDPIIMVPSPLCKEDWRKAIQNGIEFQSYEYGEHLAPYMTEEQRREYKEILASKQLPKCSFFRRPLDPQLMLSTPSLRQQHAWEMFREKGGEVNYTEGEDRIDVNQIISSKEGFHPAAMRYLVELSLATGKKLYVSSMETFHMFFAEMGCIPERSMDYISNQYIPRWLRALQNDKVYPSILKQHQDLHWGLSEGPITMVLSPLGEKRWKETIEQGTDFEPFRDGEHLVPYMTPEQNKEREKILAQKPSEAESSSNSL